MEVTNKHGQRKFPTGRLLAAAGVLLAGLALVVGLNVGGLRERLLGSGTPRIGSIAVLPFENLSKDPAQDCFADGTRQMLISDVQRVGGWRVISGTAVSQYKKACVREPPVARRCRRAEPWAGRV